MELPVPARIGRDLLLRQEKLSKPIRDIAWKAQERLCRRYRKLAQRGGLKRRRYAPGGTPVARRNALLKLSADEKLSATAISVRERPLASSQNPRQGKESREN